MADDVITVDNFAAVLPPFDPKGNCMFALVDMGR